MAIQFARCEYVSRSTGGNACRKASYNQREEIRCDRTGELFSFKERGGNAHHDILLPEGVHEKFKDSSTLWNEVERCEKRKDSQLAKEFVIALPDDAQVMFEDRLELTRRFANTHFVEKGLGVQVDIHEPDEEEKNWHAHLLVTTRRFSEDGLSFEKMKARDLDPVIRKGLVLEADVWGELWRDVQNTYFEEKGYDLRVDPIAILAQEHLGPVRMRHHMNNAIARSQELQKANEQLAHDPASVLETLTRNKAVFSEKDVELFLKKHVGMEGKEQVFESVLSHPSLLPLYDKETGAKTTYFTTKEVRAEEEKLLRFAASIGNRTASSLSPRAIEKGTEGRSFNEEQTKAYELCIQSGKNLSLIQGRAGVGKSYVLNGIRTAHEVGGYRVIGLAPTNKVATDLRESGFKEARTCHSFLFALKHGRDRLNSNTLVIIDEAGMLGTELSVELFHAVKTSGAKLVLVGDDRQLSSVDRGGAFRTLLDRYESVELKTVRRQTISWQKAVSEDLSRGDVKNAVQLLQDNQRIDWNETREEALSSLLKAWTEDKDASLLQKHILAQKNVEVDALNLGVRDILRSQGKLGDVELSCITSRGKTTFAVGDRIQLTKTDKAQGLMNQRFGVIEQINKTDKTMTVCFDHGEKKEIDPHTYDGLRHGYASTVYKAQGSTLDHVYVLHSNTTNQATNYVALTRQTQSLSLFVSKDETPTEAHLIRQMSREEGKGTSLAFDTQKDIVRRHEDKTFTTHIRDGVENLVTKVKDVFHKNEAFYQVEKPLAQTVGEVTLINPALQAVYEDWKRPAFAGATAIHYAFEKGLKIHGEEKALAYWETKKAELLQRYQQDVDKIEKELNSPLFNCRPDQWKDQARTWAKQDPTKVLNLIQKLKEDAAPKQEPKQETRTPEQQTAKIVQPPINPTEEKYLKFKALHGVLKDNPKAPASFKEDLKRLGKEVSQDKEFMAKIKLLERDEAKKIERIIQEKERTFERDRGGLSM